LPAALAATTEEQPAQAPAAAQAPTGKTHAWQPWQTALQCSHGSAPLVGAWLRAERASEELRAWKDASPTTFSAHGTTLRRPLRSASTMSCSCAHAQGAHRIYHDPGMSLIGTTLQTILTGESHGGEFT